MDKQEKWKFIESLREEKGLEEWCVYFGYPLPQDDHNEQAMDDIINNLDGVVSSLYQDMPKVAKEGIPAFERYHDEISPNLMKIVFERAYDFSLAVLTNQNFDSNKPMSELAKEGIAWIMGEGKNATELPKSAFTPPLFPTRDSALVSITRAISRLCVCHF